MRSFGVMSTQTRTPEAVTTYATASNPSRVARVVWPLIAVAVAVGLAAVRLRANVRFYFVDDTQTGAFGQWWELGDRLLQGTIPMLNPSAWQGGNYFAEGQWGLLNPVTWIIALTARAAPDAVVHVTAVKVVFLGLLALGTYLLARSFGAAPAWSALSGVLVTQVGFTVFMDATSWVTGLLCAAVFPWAWWGLRQAVDDGRLPVWFLASSYVLITFGYVFGVMVLVILLVETLVRALVARDRGRIIRALAASAWSALLTIVIYLPGVLTASVTERAGGGVLNTGFLSADLSDLAASSTTVATATINAWGDGPIHAPLAFVAWVVPLFAFVLPMPRDAVRRCIPLFVVGAIMLLVVLGPSHVGPLRWPVRFMPYLALVVVVLFAVAATRAFPARFTLRRAGLALVVLAIMAYLTASNTPGTWRSIALVTAIQAAAIVFLWFAANARWTRSDARRTVVAVASALAVTAVLIVPQMRLFPAAPLPQFGVPGDVERLRAAQADAPGDGIVVGDVYYGGEFAESYDERLLGNLWYLSEASFSSVYTVLPFSTLVADLCMDLRGMTCAEAFTTLLSEDPDTGMPVADLMAISTIVQMKSTYPDDPVLPDGWAVTDEGDYTRTITRTDPIPGAGGVAWTGSGTAVTVRAYEERELTFTVDAVGDDGRVVLSRLPWPGYRVEGAAQVDPVRGWLLTVDVSDAAPGDTVTVRFSPPGATVEITAFVAAMAVGVGWCVAWFVLRRRQSRRSRGAVSGAGESTATTSTAGPVSATANE